MKKKFIIAALVVIVLGTAGLSWSGLFRKEAVNTIRLSGNVELTEINVAFKTAGKLIELAADEGDTVYRGMPLARIDADQIEKQRDKEQAGLAVAESQLTQLNTAIQYSQATTESDVALRQAELENAQAYLKELLSGSRPQEVEQAKAALADARTQHAQATRDWERAQQLYQKDDISTA